MNRPAFGRSRYGGLRARIAGELASNLSREEYIHSRGVETEAVRIFFALGREREIWKASLAGLLHDYARYMDLCEMKKFLDEERVIVPEERAATRGLLHGFVSAHIARSRFGVCDPSIIAAVRYHTTGRPGMGFLEKVIFVSDYIEPSRRFPGVADVRHASCEAIFCDGSIDLALLHVMRDKVKSVEALGVRCFPGMLAALGSLEKKIGRGA